MERQIYETKSLGDVRAVFADFYNSESRIAWITLISDLPDSHRTLSYEAAGGPLLDLGGYILLPALMALYHNPANQKTMPKISSSMAMSRNNVDLSTCIILDFEKLHARAVLTTSHAHESSSETRATILGTKGWVCSTKPATVLTIQGAHDT
jgi:predicted dehydrogenase